jgi:hypothetical protein
VVCNRHFAEVAAGSIKKDHWFLFFGQKETPHQSVDGAGGDGGKTGLPPV